MTQLHEQFGIAPKRIARVVAIDMPRDATINEFTVGPAGQVW